VIGGEETWSIVQGVAGAWKRSGQLLRAILAASRAFEKGGGKCSVLKRSPHFRQSGVGSLEALAYGYGSALFEPLDKYPFSVMVSIL